MGTASTAVGRKTGLLRLRMHTVNYVKIQSVPAQIYFLGDTVTLPVLVLVGTSTNTVSVSHGSSGTGSVAHETS